MSESSAAAAPDSGTIPTFEELAADPEIAALLEFEPVPRRRKRREGWTAPLQRRFIAELTQSGSPTLAAEALDKKLFSAKRLYKTAGADSFRAAWDGAVALFEERAAGRIYAVHAGLAELEPPMVDRRRTRNPHPNPLPHAGEGAPGQLLNEEGEWEDEASLSARAEDARDSVAGKLLRARRLYLMEISGHPASRAAFELLTNYPIDWDKAAQGLPQDDEPWRAPNMRKPDMLLTAESGWLGNVAPGPDKQAELMRAINDWRVEQGLEAVEDE